MLKNKLLKSVLAGVLATALAFTGVVAPTTLQVKASDDDTYFMGSDNLLYRVVDADEKLAEVYGYKLSGVDDYNIVAGSEDVRINPTVTDDKGNTYDVIGIDEFAFDYCENLKSLYIPASIRYIGYIDEEYYYDEDENKYTEYEYN